MKPTWRVIWPFTEYSCQLSTTCYRCNSIRCNKSFWIAFQPHNRKKAVLKIVYPSPCAPFNKHQAFRTVRCIRGHGWKICSIVTLALCHWVAKLKRLLHEYFCDCQWLIATKSIFELNKVTQCWASGHFKVNWLIRTRVFTFHSIGDVWFSGNVTGIVDLR